MRRFTTPLVLASAALITVGGYLHLHEWLREPTETCPTRGARLPSWSGWGSP